MSQSLLGAEAALQRADSRGHIEILHSSRLVRVVADLEGVLAVVTGSLRVDLSTAPNILTDEGRDRRTLAALDHVPDGARVVVNIGDRRWPSPDAAIWLHHHADRLQLEIQGSPDADVRAWVRAVRVGRGWDAA